MSSFREKKLSSFRFLALWMNFSIKNKFNAFSHYLTRKKKLVKNYEYHEKNIFYHSLIVHIYPIRDGRVFNLLGRGVRSDHF